MTSLALNGLHNTQHSVQNYNHKDSAKMFRKWSQNGVSYCER